MEWTYKEAYAGTPLAVACPWCESSAGVRCTTAAGEELSIPHVRRREWEKDVRERLRRPDPPARDDG